MISEKEYKTAVHEYTKNVFRFLYKSLNDQEACKDIVQDCFLKLWQNRKNVDHQKIKAWLFTVAHHALINYLKVESRKTSMTDAHDKHLVFQHHDFDTKATINKVLNELPALQRSILLLRDLEGYGYKEIAGILKINESQVKVYLFRARLKVKNAIKSILNLI